MKVDTRLPPLPSSLLLRLQVTMVNLDGRGEDDRFHFVGYSTSLTTGSAGWGVGAMIQIL
jgi:hypothetical protein